MIIDLTGKIALVTGGGNGIGAASCRTLAKAGARVAVVDRDGEAAAKVASEIGGGATGHALDVADGDAFKRLVSEIATQRGGIDILVNSAGTITRQTIAAMPAADWDRIMAVNLRGPFNGTQAVIPHMKQRGGGAIVNIASVAGRRISFGGGANYTASKAGLLGLTRHAAYELAPDKIRVNAVCPGPTATAFGGGQIPSTERKAERARKIPLGRMVEAADIADAVLFLASDLSRMCTGIALDVDGGVLISNDIPYEDYFARAR
ncbi:MAG TPA: SDR family NAD(P)-dependent oxidoreductase [Stellaceae bacterium]|jgi:NAD(P)-dependent dehydrogenase (short-subunit alcohol dehydrogenase family)